VEAEGRFAQQTGGKGMFALVRVAYSPDDPAAPGVQLASEAENPWLRAQGLLDAAVLGAEIGLRLAGAPGAVRVTQVHEDRVPRSTTPMGVAIAAVRAVWAAVRFVPGEELERRLDRCGAFRYAPLDQVGPVLAEEFGSGA
jgi:hypothetical protein